MKIWFVVPVKRPVTEERFAIQRRHRTVSASIDHRTGRDGITWLAAVFSGRCSRPSARLALRAQAASARGICPALA